jgi:transposase
MSLSADTGGISPDLMLVARGGDAFAERLAQFDAAKTETMAAFEALRIGKDAAAAWDEVNAAKAEIKAKRDRTDADIAEMLQNAQAQCDTMRAEAAHYVTDARQRASEMLEAAQAQADTLKADAEAAAKEARSKALAAGKKAKAAEEASAAHEAAAAAAVAAQAAADAQAAKYNGLMKSLMAAITDSLMAEQEPSNG